MILVDLSHALHRVLWSNKTQIQDTPEFLSHVLLTQIVSISNKLGGSKKNPVVLCMDNKSWRKDYYEQNKTKFDDLTTQSYKGQRIKSDEVDWKTVYGIFEDTVESLKYHSDFFVVKAEKAEADDVIAVLTKKFKHTETVWIVSSDKDFNQLQDTNVHIYDPLKQQFRPKVDVETFKKIHIMIGDSSDNIKPIKSRLGEKTALKMLKDLNTYLQTNFDMKERYEFNKILIDFDCIPEDIEKSILEVYNEQTYSFNGMKLMTMLMKYKLAKHAEDINKFQIPVGEVKTKLNQQFKEQERILEISKSSLDEFFS